MSDYMQKQLPFEGAKEQQRLERCVRLLAVIGLPPSKLDTAAKLFNYDEASEIAHRIARIHTRQIGH